MEKTKIIIDTDLGFDCDDAGALAVANILYKKSVLDVLAITHSVNRAEGCAAVKLINEYYGNCIPVGIAEKYAFDIDRFYENFYAKMRFSENFAGFKGKPSFYKLLDEVIERGSVKENFVAAKDLIVKKLSEQEDKSVVFLEIGQMNNIATLLSDEICAFGVTYREIFKKKVKKIVAMCGNFEQKADYFDDGAILWTGEFNVIMDICSAQKVFMENDIEINVLDFNQGNNVLIGDVFSLQKENPVYKIYQKCGGGKNCESWDIVSMLYASGLYSELFSVSDCGTVKISDTGRTEFTSGKGKHRLINLQDEKTITEKINQILKTD